MGQHRRGEKVYEELKQQLAACERKASNWQYLANVYYKAWQDSKRERDTSPSWLKESINLAAGFTFWLAAMFGGGLSLIHILKELGVAFR